MITNKENAERYVISMDESVARRMIRNHVDNLDLIGTVQNLISKQYTTYFVTDLNSLLSLPYKMGPREEIFAEPTTDLNGFLPDELVPYLKNVLDSQEKRTKESKLKEVIGTPNLNEISNEPIFEVA